MPLARPGLLLAGALWAEVLPVLRRLEGRRALSRRLFLGRLAGREVALLQVGVGAPRAERRARAALTGIEASAVLSFGTCGALVGDLPIGSVVTGEAVGHEDGGEVLARALPGPRAVRVATVARVVTDRDRRERLAARGYAICEMEAWGVQRAAPHLPFHVLKVVSDQAGADADPVFEGTPIPSPLRVARFQLHAHRLVERALLPALVAAVEEAGGPA